MWFCWSFKIYCNKIGHFSRSSSTQKSKYDTHYDKNSVFFLSRKVFNFLFLKCILFHCLLLQIILAWKILKCLTERRTDRHTEEQKDIKIERFGRWVGWKVNGSKLLSLLLSKFIFINFCFLLQILRHLIKIMDFGSVGNRSAHGTPNRIKRSNRDLRNANRKTLLNQDGMETWKQMRDILQVRVCILRLQLVISDWKCLKIWLYSD